MCHCRQSDPFHDKYPGRPEYLQRIRADLVKYHTGGRTSRGTEQRTVVLLASVTEDQSSSWVITIFALGI